MGLNRKRFIKLAILVLLDLLVILIIRQFEWKKMLRNCSQMQNGNSNLETTDQRNDRSFLKLKTILFWNGAKRSELTIFGTGHDTFVQHKCPVSDCEIVNSPHQYPERTLDSYDAILFNFNTEFWIKNQPTFQRRPHQRFVFFTQESPASVKAMLNTPGYDGYFNWTMTYRMDSDIRLLYGRIRPKSSTPKTEEEIRSKIEQTHHQLDQRKGKFEKRGQESFVVAMISLCNTDGRREDYIKRLRKFIKVDIYGWCNDDGHNSTFHCETDELLASSPECYDMLETKYMFYLSFENSICPDYVTEKFFQIMNHNIVPVVYGGANYSRIAPAHSYIDALEYKPKELAIYLETLINNRTLYNEYFWWKDDYIVEAGLGQMVRHGFCDLCQKLHYETEFKTYSSLASLWDSTHCHRPKDSPEKLYLEFQKMMRQSFHPDFV